MWLLCGFPTLFSWGIIYLMSYDVRMQFLYRVCKPTIMYVEIIDLKREDTETYRMKQEDSLNSEN